MLRIKFFTAIILATLALGSIAQAGEQFEQPILLTSAGQSVDVKLAGVLLTRLGIEHTVKLDATSADLAGFKTLLLVPGYSSKGLGAAGVSRGDEMARVEELMSGTSTAGVRVITLHLGGKARRGVQSDDFNTKATAGSDLAIVVAQGDEDGFFTELCKSNEVPLEIVKVMADAMKPLEEAIAK